MIVNAILTLLFYFLGLVPPTLAAAHAATKKSNTDVIFWLKYFLFWSLFNSLLPILDSIMTFLPDKLWLTMKLIIVIAFLVPKTRTLSSTYDFIEVHFDDYGKFIVAMVRENFVAPIASVIKANFNKAEYSGERLMDRPKSLVK